MHDIKMIKIWIKQLHQIEEKCKNKKKHTKVKFKDCYKFKKILFSDHWVKNQQILIYIVNKILEA